MNLIIWIYNYFNTPKYEIIYIHEINITLLLYYKRISYNWYKLKDTYLEF